MLQGSVFQLGNQIFVEHLLNKSLLLNKGMQTVAVFNNELKSNLFVLDICRAIADFNLVQFYKVSTSVESKNWEESLMQSTSRFLWME